MVICGQVQMASVTVYMIDGLLLPQEMGGSEMGASEDMGTETESRASGRGAEDR